MWLCLILVGFFVIFLLFEMVCLRVGLGGMVGEVWVGWDRVVLVVSVMNMVDKVVSGWLIMDVFIVGFILSIWLGSWY